MKASPVGLRERETIDFAATESPVGLYNTDTWVINVHYHTAIKFVHRYLMDALLNSVQRKRNEYVDTRAVKGVKKLTYRRPTY